MKKKYLIAVLLLTLSLTGCRELAKVSRFFYGYKGPKKQTVEEQKIVLPKFDQPELAKLILRPAMKKTAIQRDPFQPIIAYSHGSNRSEAAFLDDSEEGALNNLTFLGVIKVGDKYSALLKNDLKKGERGIYSVNDRINGLTITEINEDQIVLQNGTRNFSLKRGNK